MFWSWSGSHDAFRPRDRSAASKSPLVAVAETAKGRHEDGGTHLLGVITASHLLHELLGAAGASGTP